MKLLSVICIVLSFCTSTFAQDDYSFEIPDKEEKEEMLEWSGNLDAKYYPFHSRQTSALYQLQFSDQGNLSEYLSQYRLELYLNADYQTKEIGFHLKTLSNYDNDSSANFHLLEAYGNINLSLSSFIQAGKKMYNWGKGYAFNPVGYVNPFKDPENPELVQAGRMSVNFEKIKSFNSELLKTISLTTIIIPPVEKINKRYAEIENTDIASKIYFLLWDIDLDVMGYYSKLESSKLGVDFAANVRENIEVHGEFSYFRNDPKYTIVDGKLSTKDQDGYSYLLGLRYLNRWQTTIIAEYYHNGNGLTRTEYEDYTNFLQNGIDSFNENFMKRASEYSRTYFKGNTLMQNYFYLKITQPEPFDWLYFTPSLFTIYNINDSSFLLTIPLIYKPVTNFEFIFLPTFLVGDKGTEFGSKQVQQRIELRMKSYF